MFAAPDCVRGSGLEKFFLAFHKLLRYESSIVPRMILGHFGSVKHIFNNFRASKVIFVMILAS